MRKSAPWFALLIVVTAFDMSAQYRNRRIQYAQDGITAPSSAAAEAVVRGYAERVDRPLALSREVKGPNGSQHLRFEQVANGRQVYGGYLKATVDTHGRITSLIDETVAADRVIASAVTPAAALSATMAHRFGGREIPVLYRDPIVTAVMYPAADGLHEAFLVETWEKESNLLWHTVIDARGAVAHQELRTNTDSYYIFPIQPGLTAQTVVSGPGTGGNAQSPSGWVSNNTTIGNNVDAYLDRDNNNAADSGGRPTSSTQDFIYTFDGASAPTTSTNQMLAVTNLFYLNNVIHDQLYKHGFNEAAGNFQTNNFGKGGSGNDPVNAEAQDGGGTNNANFSTPTDGSRPRMQMYLWTTTTPNRDGDLDSDIVYHEYGHGLTWRMIGSMGGGLAGAIGEGMSDVVAIYMNSEDRVGEYSTNDPDGIRRYRYNNYPLTYGDVTGSSVHGDGEIYAATMWKLRELWLGAGYSMDSLWDAVIGGMNYTPSNPEYEEMRDGILAASPTSAQDCIVWDAFAQFGIGVNAAGTDSCGIFRCTVSVTEDFTKPSTCGGGGGEEPPPSSSITLTASGSKSKGSASVNLAWSGATSTSVDVFRNGSKLTTTSNDGAHTDALGKGVSGTYTYKVCEAGTTTCSANASVTF